MSLREASACRCLMTGQKSFMSIAWNSGAFGRSEILARTRQFERTAILSELKSLILAQNERWRQA